MIVLGLQGAHTGDILMALPAIAALLARGEKVGVACPEAFTKPLRHLPITWARENQATEFADFKRKHRTDAWLDHFGVTPIKMLIHPQRTATDPCLPQGRWCLLSPWADAPDKRWDSSRWIAIGQAAMHEGYQVAIVGPQRANVLGLKIASACGAVDLVGRCTPRTWPALLAQASLVITPDTGAGHMADALSVPVIGLYGATCLHDCAPYWDRQYCVEAKGMDAISTAMVIDQLRAA